jgi:hypothetical protein
VVEPPQESQELLMTIPLVAFSDDLALQSVQRGESVVVALRL